MKWLYILVLFIVLIAGIWYFYGGSLDMLPGLSGNNYSALAPYIKKLPFEVYVPKYLPAGFEFQEKDSVALQRGTNMGIPQFNLLFSRGDNEDGLVFRQFDRARYKTDILDHEKIPGFDSYFKDYLKIAPVIRDGKDGKEIYADVSKEKKRTMLGELQYVAAGYFLKDDSLFQISYSGNRPLAEEEIIKIILSIKPF